MGYLAKQDENGLYYGLDNEHSRLLCFDDNADLRFVINAPGDQISQGLYIDDFSVAKEGIYLSVTEWDGMLLAREAILLYDHNGKYLRTITNRDYSKWPTNKHRFRALESVNGTVRYLECLTDELLIGKQHIPYKNAFNAVADAAYDGNTLYILDKTGKIKVFSEDYKSVSVVYDRTKDKDSSVVPYRFCVGSDGQLYFSDIKNMTVRKVDPKGKDSSVVIDSSSSLTVSTTEDDAFLLMEDGLIVQDGDSVHEYRFLHKNTGMIVSQIICVVVFVFFVLLTLLLLLRLIGYVSHRKYTSIVLSSMMSITLVSIVSLLLCTMLLNSFRKSYREKIEEQVKSAAYMVANQIDGSQIEAFKKSRGFGGKEYEYLVGIMERSFPMDIDFFKQIYCNIDTLDENGQGYAICYLDQSIGDYYPLEEDETQNLQEVYKSRRAVWNQSVMDVSGTYLSIKVPIFRSGDKVVGAVDVGAETYVIDETLNAVILKVFMSIVVILMLVWVVSSEIMGFVSNYSIYQKERWECGEEVLPAHLMRILIFLIFSAYNMTATFLPVYLIRRTDLFPHQWKEIAGALPITINLFIIGLMSLFCAGLIKRFGIKKIMAASTLSALLGNGLIFIWPGYFTIGVGLIFDGIGVGLITNALYVLITYIKDPAYRTWGLSIYNGACLSGINFGMLLGSLLAVSLGQRQVFLVVAASWLLLMFLGNMVVSKLDHLIAGEEEKESDGKPESAAYRTSSYLSGKPIWSFIVLIQNPYIIFGSFVFYFLPLFCDEHGYSETICSLLIMLYSEIAVLIGDSMTKWSEKRLGSHAMYAACMLNVAALGIYSLHSELWGMILALIILGLSASFGKPVQQDYFLGLRETRKYGEDRAMGIYNFSENIGESLGPIIMGRLMGAVPLAPAMTGFLGVLTGTNVLHYLLNKGTLRNRKQD